MPRRKQNTTSATLVLDILERVHHIGNAPQAAQATETGAPSTITVSIYAKKKPQSVDLLCRISSLKRHTSHSPLTARRAVCRRRSPSQTRNGRGALVYGAALCLWGHGGLRVGCVDCCGLLGLGHGLGLHVLLGRRRAMWELLGRRSRILLLLLGLVCLSIRVLMVNRRLTSHVRRCWVLLHGYWRGC
jgi:hypothetical protein